MGTSGILDRYRQIRPKIIFASSETVYAGKTINITHKIADVERELRIGGYGLEKVVVVSSEKTGDLVLVPNWWVLCFQGTYDLLNSLTVPMLNSLTIDAFLISSSAAVGYPLTFEQLPFDHPLYILYSSGTSGPPKCIVHAAGVSLDSTDFDLVFRMYFVGCTHEQQEGSRHWPWDITN